jgi:phosphohistidine swiveling domain-containing protein
MDVKNGWTGCHIYLIEVFQEISKRTAGVNGGAAAAGAGKSGSSENAGEAAGSAGAAPAAKGGITEEEHGNEECAMAGVPVSEIHAYYFLEDIKALIMHGKRVGSEEKSRREAGVLFHTSAMTSDEVSLAGGEEEQHYERDGGDELSFASSRRAHDSSSAVMRRTVGPEAAKLFEEMPCVKDIGLRGTVASAGLVTGRARIIGTNDGKTYTIEPGDIIVTIMAQPQQYQMLKACAGIVTDEGGILSHAAIVARELGIPCIAGVTAATKKIQEGSTITIVAEGPEKGSIKVLC